MRVVKDNKEGLYIADKRKIREDVHLVLNRAGALVTQNMENAGVLNAAFALVFK